MPEGEWFCPACIKKKVLRGEAMTVSEGKTVKQVELSSEYVKKLAAKRRKKEEEEEEEEEGVNFYETKRVKKKEEEDVDVAEGRELELNVLWFLIGMTRRSASTFC